MRMHCSIWLKRILFPAWVVVLVLGLDGYRLAVSAQEGFQGRAWERLPDGRIGPLISGVEITFVKEDRSVTRKVTTDDRGFYRVTLTRGRYVVTAAHCRYLDYSSAPGFFVVTGAGWQTGNIFLKKTQVTTVLLVRHAEKSNDALTPQGLSRAEKLAHAARKAGVRAIYTTNFNRTRQTVQPLAQALNLQPIIYSDIHALVGQVMANNRGDVVLIAGHSNTIPEIISAFGGDRRCCPIDNEFDNLCLVVIGDTGKVSVIHLQYGDPSP